jgi:IclR family transcriptional regulator, KDG regulon repressor
MMRAGIAAHLRVLHASERPLNASEVARAAGLHRGTAYNILRTLQAEGFVGYDEGTRTYAVSLQILELAYGVLRRSGLIDIARPLMHAVSDAHGVSVYLSRYWDCHRCCCWIGSASRCVPIRTSPSGGSIRARPVHRVSSSPPSATAAKRNSMRHFPRSTGTTSPPFSDFLARAKEARQLGFAVDRDTMFRGVTLVSVPVLSPSWELLLILTAAGLSHDLADEAVGALSRAIQSAAPRLSDSLPLLRLG